MPETQARGVRFNAAPVAVDAPPVSYPDEPRGGRRGRARCRAVPGVLAAVAPIVGTARVASATEKIVGLMCLPDPTPSGSKGSVVD
jgi:hypothetical protein